MKGIKLILLSVLIMSLGGCIQNSGNSDLPFESTESLEVDESTSNSKDTEDIQYEKLSLYMIKSDLYCSALLDTKQITVNVEYSILLTSDGSIYEVSTNSDLYSNNENCIEIKSDLENPVDWIHFINSLFSREQFYSGGKFYESSKASEIIQIRSSENSDQLIKRQNLYGEYMFIGMNYIQDNVVFFYDSELKKYIEVPIVGLENDEKILRYLSHSNRTVVVTSKAIYTFNSKTNKDECEKYKDVECKSGYVRNSIMTDIYVNTPDILLYFDGEVFIDKQGNYYRLKWDYDKN